MKSLKVLLTPISLITGFLLLGAGIALGWFVRAQRAGSEKAAINDGWREQMDSRGTEHKRLADQNKTLMQQVADLNQATEQHAAMSKRLVKERESIEAELEAARQNANRLKVRNQELENSFGTKSAPADDSVLRERIAWLESELDKWQERLPPLIEKWRERDADAGRLERQLAEAEERLAMFEAQPSYDETRFDPVRPGDIDDMDTASNQPLLQVVTESANSESVALTDIKGIGPAISKTLGEQGVASLEDLVEMSPEQIDAMGDHIKGFANKHPNWVEQARELLGYAETS